MNFISYFTCCKSQSTVDEEGKNENVFAVQKNHGLSVSHSKNGKKNITKERKNSHAIILQDYSSESCGSKNCPPESPRFNEIEQKPEAIYTFPMKSGSDIETQNPTSVVCQKSESLKNKNSTLSKTNMINEGEKNKLNLLDNESSVLRLPEQETPRIGRSERFIERQCTFETKTLGNETSTYKGVSDIIRVNAIPRPEETEKTNSLNTPIDRKNTRKNSRREDLNGTPVMFSRNTCK